MEWLTIIKDAIEYMEQNLLTVTGPEEVAKHAHISTIYLQRGFQVLTGYTLGEYIRNRRLFEAGLKLTQTDEKVIDIALEYGYETPESFTKAFTRFHGTTPIEVRRDRSKMQLFLPLHVSIKIQGGSKMNYTVEKTEAFTVIGFERLFSFETSYKEIPDFWAEMYKIHAPNIFAGKGPKTEVEHAIMENYIGEFGVCIEDAPAPGKFRYMIAGPYQGGKVPQGMKLYTVPANTWAKFACVGTLPNAMQSVNTKIWSEWLPGNKEYDLAGKYNIEWYSADGDPDSADYESAIWIPVIPKK